MSTGSAEQASAELFVGLGFDFGTGFVLSFVCLHIGRVLVGSMETSSRLEAHT